jgi:hypothetical protein
MRGEEVVMRTMDGLRRGVCMVALLVLAGPATARAAEILVYPSADTYVSSADPDLNFGSGDRLVFGNDIGALDTFTEAYLRFDLSAVDTVYLAELDIYRIGCTDCPVPYDLRAVAGDWSEGSVTWNTRPPSGLSYITGEAFSQESWETIDVTGLVREWKSGSLPNHGLVLIAQNALGSQSAEITSREWPSLGERCFLRILTEHTAVAPATWGRMKARY